MIILDDINSSLEVLLAGAITTSQLPWLSSYVDITTSAFTPGKQKGTTNSTTAVTVLSAPSASTQRQLKFFSISNQDTASATVTFRLNVSAAFTITVKITLAVGDTLLYTDGEGFRVIDSSGKLKVTTAAGGGGGDNITVNTVAVTDAEFNDTTPAAPGGDLNVKFQRSGSGPDSVSAYVDVSVLEPLLTLGNLGGTIGTTQIANDAVTYAKMQNVSATDKVLGRSTAGAGDTEEIACTAAGRALIDDADAAAQRTTLGLSSIAIEATPLALAKGGTGQATQTAAMDALSPVTTRGDIIIRNATNNVRLAVGAAARLLRSDGTDPSWAQAVLTTDVSGVLPVANGGFQAGSAAAASWPTLAAGTVLTTPEAGAFEFDGTAHFETIDATTGRGQVCAQHIFRLAANGSAIGSAIADYFGANSAFPTVTNGVYEIWAYLWFLKSTAGTVTITITNSQTYTNIAAMRFNTNATSGVGNGAGGAAGMVTTTVAAAALPASSSLADAVNHLMLIYAIAECGTAGNIRIRATESAGTITPLRGSYYTARRLYAGNVGIFVA